jgi:hypothetical protein
MLTGNRFRAYPTAVQEQILLQSQRPECLRVSSEKEELSLVRAEISATA